VCIEDCCQSDFYLETLTDRRNAWLDAKVL